MCYSVYTVYLYGRTSKNDSGCVGIYHMGMFYCFPCISEPIVEQGVVSLDSTLGHWPF